MRQSCTDAPLLSHPAANERRTPALRAGRMANRSGPIDRPWPRVAAARPRSPRRRGRPATCLNARPDPGVPGRADRQPPIYESCRTFRRVSGADMRDEMREGLASLRAPMATSTATRSSSSVGCSSSSATWSGSNAACSSPTLPTNLECAVENVGPGPRLTHRSGALRPSCWRLEPGKNHDPGSDQKEQPPPCPIKEPVLTFPTRPRHAGAGWTRRATASATSPYGGRRTQSRMAVGTHVNTLAGRMSRRPASSAFPRA